MIYCAYKRRRTMKLINKIIRKVTASELAQATVGGIIEGETDAHFAALIRQAGSGGRVLLKNNDDVLPFNENDNVAVFGRVQNDWFYVGNGSGGDVCNGGGHRRSVVHTKMQFLRILDHPHSSDTHI